MPENLRAKSSARIENRLFTETRIGLVASGWAFGYGVILARLLIQHNIPTGLDGRHCADFTWIWLSSRLVASGGLGPIYDYSLFSAWRADLVGPPNCLLDHFDYPPTLLLLTYPLGSMPYLVAFATWMAVTLALYLTAIYEIVPRPAAVVAALTPFPVFINFLLGHNGFLTAGLMGLALVFVERRPWVSGIFFGLLIYKPQFGILVPLALLVARNWRVLVGAAATTVVFSAAAAVVFGSHVWPLFINALADRASVLNQDPREVAPLVSVFGSLRTLGVGPHISWTAQLVVSAIAAATVCALWSRQIPHSLKAAALCIGSLVAAPHAISYDVCILSVASAFLVADGLARGFLLGERVIILMCWPALVLAMGPVPVIVGVVLLVLVVRRALPRRREAPATRMISAAS
jgi:Glycosyltransferase family 87